MKTKILIQTGLMLLGGVALTSTLLAQDNLQYPSPRYPELMEVKGAEDLLDIARVVVSRPSRAQSGFLVGYGVQPGQRVLIAVDSKHDRLVVRALELAIAEIGAKPDVTFLDYHSFFPPMEPADGAKELDYFLYPEENVLRSKLFVKRIADAAGEYDVVIHGTGGGNPAHSGYRWEKIPWQTLDEFISGAVEYPADVQEAIDKKVWETLLTATKVRITDPQGTDVSWSVKREDHEKGMERHGTDILSRGHIGSYPALTDKSVLDAKGVVGGTANHTGVFPHIEVYIDNNKLTRIEGGGSYGENWQALLERYKDVQWPGQPGPGMAWLFEVAIGTNPKASRPANLMQESTFLLPWERARSGVIHWGIGIYRTGPEAPEIVRFAKARKLPYGHMHIHTYFSTLEIETEDGEKLKIIDRGHLTALDDPEIRKLAAEHGNPDEILREAWIPAIPGINVEGDYENDYAGNPASWITQEHEKAYGDWLRRHY